MLIQQRVAFGWIALTLVQLMMDISTLTLAAINTDFSEFVYHPGPGGWGFMCVLFAIYVSMAIAVPYFDAPWFRWLNVILLATVTLFMLNHQIGHMLEGKVHGVFGVVDLVHHVVGALVTVQAFRWARAGKDAVGLGKQ